MASKGIGDNSEDHPSEHMTLIQRHLNVDATSCRCIDVDPTLYKRHVPAGMFFQHRISYYRSRLTYDFRSCYGKCVPEIYFSILVPL